MKPNPALRRLGLDDWEVAVIIQADDVGMCHASVEAFTELWERRGISSGAVMVPCPWFLAVARYAHEHPEVDLGVHLTLNCEWETYRWGPVSRPPAGSGLVDEHGHLHRTAAATQEQAAPGDVAAEIRARIERAADFEAFASRELRDFMGEAGIHVVGHRALHSLMPPAAGRPARGA